MVRQRILTSVCALGLLAGVSVAHADDTPVAAPTTTTTCTTAWVNHGGPNGRVLETTCTRVVEAPPLTPAQVAERLLTEQRQGPPIPGRGGPRWEGDTEYTAVP